MKTTGQEFVLETFDRKKNQIPSLLKRIFTSIINLIEIFQVNQKRNEFFLKSRLPLNLPIGEVVRLAGKTSLTGFSLGGLAQIII